MFSDIYSNRRVLVTGHTGVKGSWLAFWLNRLGAETLGVALPPETEPNHWDLLRLPVESRWCNVRDGEKLKRIFAEFKPEIVFHLAAQALVRPGYADPAATFAVNVGGTVNVLEACRNTPSVRAAVMVTSDKCYENRERMRPYREDDPLGGHDPYSASKGCAEIVISSYRRSFFPIVDFGKKHRLLLASARAGNVVGGGDWAADRLIPDLVRAAAAGKDSVLRSPESIRPWQHVLEPLSGYLALGQRLLNGEPEFAAPWNFGPSGYGAVTVARAARIMADYWPDIRFDAAPSADAPHEAKLLRLDCSKARRELNWRGVWTPREAFRAAAGWYRFFYTGQGLSTAADLADYLDAARKAELPWTR